MMYLTIMILFALFAGIAMTVNEGLWSNAVSLLCVLVAGVIAAPWGLKLAAYAIEQAGPEPDVVWFYRFASIWGVFFLSNMLLRVFTDRISRVRMKFIKPLEMAGGPVVGILVAVMLASFAACTMRVPVAAGAWTKESGWATSTMTNLQGPFHNVINGFYQGEFTVEQFEHGLETPSQQPQA